jgi:hypothetical protein
VRVISGPRANVDSPELDAPFRRMILPDMTKLGALLTLRDDDGASGSAVSDGYRENRNVARARALAASSARSRGGALVSSEARSLPEAAAISAMAVSKAASFALDGLLNPLILRTNCKDAARISSSVTGGAKLKSILIFLHMSIPSIRANRVPC